MSAYSTPTTAAEDLKAEQDFAFFRDYGWNWFNYHAGQRTSMFNYSLAASSLLAAGFGAAIDKHPYIAAAIGIVGAMVTWSFFLIDGRNDKLVRRGERVMKALETMKFPNVTQAPPKDANNPMPGGILIVNEDGVRTNVKDRVIIQYLRGTHRIHLRFIELTFFVAFLCGAIAAMWQPDAFRSSEPPVAESVKALTDQVTQLTASLAALTDRMSRDKATPASDSVAAAPTPVPPRKSPPPDDRH